MRRVALILLAPCFLAWTAGGSGGLVREASSSARLDEQGRVNADGIATGTPEGVEVVLTLPLPGRNGDGSGVLGLSIPQRTLASRARLDAGDAVYARYREYNVDGVVVFDNEGVVAGPFDVGVDPWSGVYLDFVLAFPDSEHPSSRRVLVADGYFLRMLGDAPSAGGGVEAGGEIVLGVGDDGYDDDYYDDGYESTGCDGDDWGDDDEGYDDESSSGCDGDDWDSGGSDGGGCDGGDSGGSSAPSCDCEGDALASASGRRSPVIARAFNWAPWLLVVGFIHGMKRRRWFSARRWSS